jgi:DNA polymerase III gamma/tau subunit
MPMYDRARVFIIEEADQLSTGAGNALLKILETPQENVHFILLSMQAGGVSNAIQSRCLTFNFKPVGIADTMRALKRIMEKEELWSSPAIPESFKMEGLAAIAGNAKGSLREALQLLERCLEGEYWTAALIQENLGIVDEVATYRILDALLSFSKAEEVWTSIYNSDPGELYNYITLILADAMICKLTGFTKDERFASSTKQLASNSNLELLYSALTNYAPLAKPYTRRADLLAAIANYYMKGAPVLREETIPQRVVGRRMVAGRST